MFISSMIVEKLKKISDISQDPNLVDETQVVNVDVLKQRLINEKKKENINSSVKISIFLLILAVVGILLY